LPLVVGPNVISTVVTAQDGVTTQTYTLTITRISNNAALSNIKVSPATTLTGAGGLNYITTVRNSESTVKITATAQSRTATIKINGVTVASGTASADIPLNVGDNVINIVVTAQDGVTTKTYSIKFTRLPPPSVNLSSFAISSGTLSPVFAADTTSYTATVGTATITVTPATSDADLIIKVNGTTVASGTASPAFPLIMGDNVITTVVTSNDGITTKTYTFKVTRVSNNAALTSLKINPSTTLTGAGGLNYTTTVPNTEASVQITATAQNTTATIKINGVTVASGTASAAIPLNVGDNVINTVVTARDGVTVKTYSIKFTRLSAPNATLANLALSRGTLTPVFASGTTIYTASVSNATASITVTPTTSNTGATVKVNGKIVASGAASAALPLVVGPNVISTVVTAPDGVTTQTYTVTITRISINAALSSIKINPATTLTGAGGLNYTTIVPNSESTVKITATVQDATATIKINGVTVPSGTASGAIPLYVGDNVINTVVTAQDGVTVKTYSIKFTRLSAPSASLANLVLSSGTLSPVFASGTTIYTALVSSDVASIKIIPTTNVLGATVKVNGVTVASGTASAALPLLLGLNTITTVVTAPDGITTQTYTLTVNRASKYPPFLISFKLDPATTLLPIRGLNYKTTVPNSESTVKITATASNSTATVKINGVTVASGTPSAAIPLNVGDKIIFIVLTAQDGVTTKTYSIKFTRLPPPSASLASLTISSGTLSPVFATGIINYTASVSNATASVTVTPTVLDATATIKVNGTTVASGSASAALPLVVGPNIIRTVVTAQDGVTSQTYTLTITRISNNAALSSIKITPPTTLTGAGGLNYTTTVPNTEASVQITATAQSPTAIIKINGVTVASGTTSAAIPLNVGDNVINSVVTAQDGVTVKTYSIKFTRLSAPNATLANLVLSSGTLTPVFASGTTIYTASVSSATASITVTPTTSNTGATVKVNGTTVASGTASAALPLVTGPNTITTVATAPDGITTQTYRLTVTRISNNAALSSLEINPSTLLTGAGGLNYTTTVPNSESTVKITPTTQDATATVKVNGVTVASGTASGSIALNVGTTLINTVVTAQDGTTTKTYSITFTKPGPIAAIMKYDQQEQPISSNSITVHRSVSPNGDGINDVLIIDGITTYPENKVQIMSRSGALIYEAKGYDNNTKVFDGHGNNGKLQKAGTYFYSLEYKDGDETKHKAGFIVLKY